MTIKSSRYGMDIRLDPEVPFDRLTEALRVKFRDSARFFKGAKMAVSFTGRVLSLSLIHIFPVTTVADPELCVVKGLQKIILTKGYYKKLTYSMLDENYRWLR